VLGPDARKVRTSVAQAGTLRKGTVVYLPTEAMSTNDFSASHGALVESSELTVADVVERAAPQPASLTNVYLLQETNMGGFS